MQTEKLTDEERQNILQSLERRERDFTRLQRQRLSATDFELLTIIGRGAFGEVYCLAGMILPIMCMSYTEHHHAYVCIHTPSFATLAGQTVQAENQWQGVCHEEAEESRDGQAWTGWDFACIDCVCIQRLTGI